MRSEDSSLTTVTREHLYSHKVAVMVAVAVAGSPGAQVHAGMPSQGRGGMVAGQVVGDITDRPRGYKGAPYTTYHA